MISSLPLNKVAVIGASGRMGRWFTHYFVQSNTVQVSVYDKKKFVSRSSKRIKHGETIRSCVKEADLVIVCVPIETISSVVRECLINMKIGSALVEISSIKRNIFGVLRAARRDITCLCIHPMFGPATRKSGSLKYLLIPVRNESKEIAFLDSVFPQSEIEVICNPDLHDEYMAVVIGLIYYVNIVLGSMLSKLDLATMKRVAGTSFGMQVMITESILNDSPELVSSLLQENPFNKKYIANFLTEAQSIEKVVTGLGTEGARSTIAEIQTQLNKLTDTGITYLKFYSAIDYLKTFDSKKELESKPKT
jgi:prephenate dehydrogenase